jgi:thioredoxin reductase
MADDTIFDVAIVGGGPAGLSAAIFLARYLHSVVLIDSGDPRSWETRGIHGFLGLPDVTPAELRGRGRDQARHYGALLVDGLVDTVERVGDERFRLRYRELRVREDPDRDGVVEAEAGVHSAQARRILLAIGIKDIWPDVQGLEHAYGETAHHCPDCDGYEARGCRTVVIGSGRKAVGMAFDLATWTRDLVICANGVPADIDAANLAKLDALNIPVLQDRIHRLVSRSGRVRQLELAGGKCLDCDRIFFAIGSYPADDLGAQLGCERGEDGLIVVRSGYRTSVPHVFAAGDIVPGSRLAITAASDGAIAAIAIHRSLRAEAYRLE